MPMLHARSGQLHNSIKALPDASRRTVSLGRARICPLDARSGGDHWRNGRGPGVHVSAVLYDIAFARNACELDDERAIRQKRSAVQL